MELGLESVFSDAPRLCDEVVRDVDINDKLRRLSLQALACSATYGWCMGIRHSVAQAFVSAVKVPALFLLTLLICLPALHFVGLLFGSRVRFLHSLTLLVAGVATTSTLLAAFAPIALFFLVGASSYPFMLLLHVAIFAFAGLAGLRSVHASFHHVAASSKRLVLPLWMTLYAFVGTQMAYLLGPFVGRDAHFFLFRHGSGNFYSYVLSLIGEVLR